jgi:cell division transport system ATP-binding protein
VIQLFHVDKAYPGDAPVLDDITLRIEKGEFVWLTGPSGAGKSTLLKLLFCAETPTSGQILVGGRNIVRLSQHGIPYLRRNIGVVFQDFKLLGNRTVLENVGYSLEVLGFSDSEIRERSRKRLEQVGLSHKASSLPRRLSGGEQQRVAIARALVNRPRLMLFDEVTSALDPELVAEVLSLIRELKSEGMTMIVATHEMGFARDVADRVCFLDGGRVHEQGPPEQIFGNPQEIRTRQFLGRIIEAGRL